MLMRCHRDLALLYFTESVVKLVSSHIVSLGFTEPIDNLSEDLIMLMQASA